MNTIFSQFQGKLTKFKAKVTENNVSQLFSFEHRSIYDAQSFLIDLAKECNQDVMPYFQGNVFWDNMTIGFTGDVEVSFDVLDSFRAEIKAIKVRKKYSPKDMGDIYTYELLLEKEVDKEIDPLLIHCMNYTEEDENGTKHLVDFPIELKYIPPAQTDLFEGETEVEREHRLGT